MAILMRCPHCESRAVARKSQAMSRLLREIVYVCTNPTCGHTYVALLEVVRTLSPSAMPDPSICLPLSSHARACRANANAKRLAPPLPASISGKGHR